MSKHQVLVVDDSAVLRKRLTNIIQTSPLFHVVGIARNGTDAIEKVKRLKPSLILMDIDMPVMDGLIALQQIMKHMPTSIIMAGESYNEEIQQRCKQLGAADFVVKSHLISPKHEGVISGFHELLLRAVLRTMPPSSFLEEDMPVKTQHPKKRSSGLNADLVVIGCSTGGPSALQAILPFFTKDFAVPVMVLQHMPPGFTKPLAERLNNNCPLTVKEAEDGEKLEAGYIYIAPAGYQTTVKQQERLKVFSVAPSTGEHLYKPSIDVTLQSLAPIYKERLLVSILTGMGVDGTKGCKEVKYYNGHVLTEAQSTCVVYGMPKSVFEAGYADEVAELHSMYKTIMRHLQS